MKWAEETVIEVIKEAREAGRIAAENKLGELTNAGPKWAVTSRSTVVGTLLDVCGFATMKISARGKFFQLAKKLSQERQYRFYCRNAYGGGGGLSIFDSTNRQEMSVNRVAAEAHAGILAKYGIEARVETRID